MAAIARGRKDDGDDGAFVGGGIDHQLAIVQIGQPLDDGQPQPGSFMPAVDRTIELAERLQRLGHIFRFHADAGVGDGQGDGTVGLLPDVEPDDPARRGELDRVGQQIQDDLADTGFIARNHGAGRRRIAFHPDAAGGGGGFDQRELAARHRRQIQHRFTQRQLAGIGPRQVQHIADEGKQMPAAADDIPHVALVPGTAQGTEKLVPQDLREADDGVQRGPQFMAHHGQEFGFGAVRLFGLILGGAQENAGFHQRRHVGMGADHADRLVVGIVDRAAA